VLKSALVLVEQVGRQWFQFIGGTGMAVVGFAAEVWELSIPKRVWFSISAALFLWALLRVFHEARINLASAEASVRELEDYQRRADRLTEKYRYGVKTLINDRPWGIDELTVWQTECRQWFRDVVEILKQTNCTAQDINHFETVLAELWHREDYTGEDETVALMKIRLQRLADISTKYAKFAEETHRRPEHRS